MTESATQPHKSRLLHDKRLLLEKTLGLSGALALCVAFFAPWFSSGGMTLSGWRLAAGAFPVLFLLPPAAIGAVYVILSRRRHSTRTILIFGVVALLSLIVATAKTFNDGEGNFRYKTQSGSLPELVFRSQAESFALPPAASLQPSLFVTVGGALLLYLAPLVRHEPKRAKRLRESPAEMRRKAGQTLHLHDLRPQSGVRRDVSRSLLTLVAGGLLIYTYTWCGISFSELWENRGNAKDYLLGRELSEADMAYVNDQKERAAIIEAKGRAREVMDNKYRGVPFEQQPGYAEKAAERDRLADQFLAGMTGEEKERLGRRAYRQALEEKKGGYFPPETAWPRVRSYLVALLETFAMAIWGSLLAVVCALPVSLFAADNTLRLMVSGDGPARSQLRAGISFAVRRLMDACRGFNEFVMALIFVAIIGLGPFAGILALWIHTFGVLGKVFSEQIEAIDGGQIEAVSSTGASVPQTIAFSVLPQVMPGFISYSLLRFESNVRSAAILGFVGAGGIGFLIFDKLNGYLFREVCTMMIIVIASVAIIDNICKALRKRVI